MKRFEDCDTFKAWKRELEASRSQDGRNQSPKVKSQKPDCPIRYTGVSGFFRTDRV
jgi:hypothetical protein